MAMTNYDNMVQKCYEDMVAKQEADKKADGKIKETNQQTSDGNAAGK